VGGRVFSAGQAPVIRRQPFGPRFACKFIELIRPGFELTRN
jgi:hypothetical protein